MAVAVGEAAEETAGSSGSCSTRGTSSYGLRQRCWRDPQQAFQTLSFMPQDPFVDWFEALEARHLANLNFSEVRRAVQALSIRYVEKRHRFGTGGILDGEGKRAAFAMFYGPLHFLLVRQIVRALHATVPNNASILDVGAGTGVAGAAWALESLRNPAVIGVDHNPWALSECKWTYRTLGLRGRVQAVDLASFKIPAGVAVIAAFTVNEVDEARRAHMHSQFLSAIRRGTPVLIVEPIARRLSSWWEEWATSWKSEGGRADEWRFRLTLPEKLQLMDRAAGLDHRELTGRSLWAPGST